MQMLWDHPYAGPYAFAEWLISVIFWVVIFLVIGAWMAGWIPKHRRVSNGPTPPKLHAAREQVNEKQSTPMTSTTPRHSG